MLLFVFVALPFAPAPGDGTRALVPSPAWPSSSPCSFLRPRRDAQQALRLVTPDDGPVALPERYRQRIGHCRALPVRPESLRHFRNVLMIVTSVVIWLLETVKYWFVMQAFPFEVSFFADADERHRQSVTTLPSAPGYVGRSGRASRLVVARL